MSVIRHAERTPWLAGQRIRAYSSTVASLVLLVPILSAIPLMLVDPPATFPLAFGLMALGLVIGVVLRRRSLRGLRMNNGGVVLMTRGEDGPAADAFRRAAHGGFSRDAVAISLYNLGVLALRGLDVPSAVALQRAAIATARGVRFPWQPNVVGNDYARPQLAFLLAARAESSQALDEAAAVLDANPDVTSAQAIAFSVRARALLAIRREQFAEAVDLLDQERALLRNVLPLKDAVLCDAMMSYALLRLGDSHRGASRAHAPVLADEEARAYVRCILPAAEAVLTA